MTNIFSEIMFEIVELTIQVIYLLSFPYSFFLFPFYHKIQNKGVFGTACPGQISKGACGGYVLILLEMAIQSPSKFKLTLHLLLELHLYFKKEVIFL